MYLGDNFLKGALWLEGSSSSSSDGYRADQPSHNHLNLEANLDEKRASKGKAHPSDPLDNINARFVSICIPPTATKGFRRTFLILFVES